MRVARNREPGVTLEQIAADFGVHPITLQGCGLGCVGCPADQADREGGARGRWAGHPLRQDRILEEALANGAAPLHLAHVSSLGAKAESEGERTSNTPW
ncbi:hypothetical protein ABZ499_35605 [Streptomyces sp. NPDC019990]|uniref:hypothetical protein n=1 Tax=Streptomyces sp. NPDC019990 TaxID=3154693 RepID=UPI0033F54DD7